MYNFYRLYGGELLPKEQVDPKNDWIPIRDASMPGNDDAKHKKITVQDLKDAIGSLVISSRNPISGDIGTGNAALWQNSAANTVYGYANFGGVLWRSTPWNIWVPSGVYTFDSTTLFFDSTTLTWDLT